MKDTNDSFQAPHRRSITFRVDATDVDLNDKPKRKIPLSSKDDIWLIRSLKESIPHQQYEKKMLTRIHNFVEKIEENWLHKLQAVRDVFEETIARIVQQRLTEIYYSTSCLKEELQDVKDRLDRLENFDSTNTSNLKDAWFAILYNWKTDMFEMEERSTKFLKNAVARYLSKLVATRHNPCHTFDVMLTLVLELNHIIIGNVQAIIETDHDLGLLWDSHFKKWCVAYYLRVGLTSSVIPEEEENECEEEEKEIKGLAALDSILELILSHSKETTDDRIVFQKPSNMAVIPYLVYLENQWERFKDKEKFVLDVLQSEAEKLINIKKFLWSLKHDELCLFTEWSRNAGYGEDAEPRFIRGAEMAVNSIKELKSIMLKTMELWNDLAERLEGLRYVIELSHEKQMIQIATTFQEWEIQMNLVIDELRQAHSLIVLENMWNFQVDKLVVDYQNMLVGSLQNEKDTLDMYTPMSKMTFELFLNALDLLIMESWVSTNTRNIPQQSVTSYNIKDLEDCNFKLSEIITTCVSNARTGFVESMKFFRKELLENIDILDTTWLINKKAELDWRFEMKSEMMKRRLHRMKTDVLDVRTTELKIHEEALYRHTEAIREKLVLLSSIDIAEVIQPLVEDFHAVADDVLKLNTKVSPGSFPRVIASLEQAKQKFIDLCLRYDHDSQRAYEHIDRYFEWIEQITLQLLRDIKLFSERGNFSSDEVSTVLFVLQRIDKEMTSERKTIDNKFTKGVILNDMEIGYKIEKFITYMKNTQIELLHKSNLRLTINRAKRAIKREIFNGRALLKKAESILTSDDDIKDVAILPKYLEATMDAFSFLAVPEDFFDLAGNIASRASSNSLRRPKVSFGKSMMKRGQRNSEFKERRSLVFKLVSEEDVQNNFLYKIVYIISKCKEGLHYQIFNFKSQDLMRQTESSVVLSTRNAIKGKLQKGSNIFQEIEPELNEIYRQSIIVWMDMINESLKLYKFFGDQIVTILNSEYKKFENAWLSSLEVIENQLREELKEFDVSSTKYKEEMKRRLKTMFGHPKHKEHLSALTHEAVEFCKSQTQDLKTIILYRRNQVKQLLLTFFNEKKPFIDGLYDEVENVYENEDLERILFRLGQYLLSRSKSKNIINSLIFPREQKQHSASGETKLEEEARSDLSSEWKVTPDVHALIKSVTGKMRRIISHNDQGAVSNASAMDVGFVLQDPDEYVLLCTGLKKSLLKAAMKICQLSKLALAVYIEEMQTWLSNWRTDCSRLCELYSFNPSTRDKHAQNQKMPHKREIHRNSPTYSYASSKRASPQPASSPFGTPKLKSLPPTKLSNTLSGASHSRTTHSVTSRARK